MNDATRSQPERRATEAWGTALGLGLMVAILFFEAFFQGRVFYERDIQGYWYPAIEAFVRAVHEGSWPVWDPYPAFGAPMLPDPSYQIAYPSTWLNLIMPPDLYFKLFVLAHCVGGGLGLHRLCRRRGLGPSSSFLAAGLWISSGPLLSSISLFHHFAAATWMPWVLLALDVALERGTVGSALGLGAAAAGQSLAGSADLCFMTGLLAAGAALGFAFGGHDVKRWQRIGFVIAISLPFAATLAAVQWLPAFAALRWGTRAAMAPTTNLYWSIHPLSLLDVFVPRLLADAPLTPTARAALFESREPLLVSLYLGLAAGLILAGAVLARKLPRAARWAGLGLVVFLLAALGRHTPVLLALVHWWPFSVFRYPAKYVLPASLLWAVVAAAAFEAWQADWDTRTLRRSRFLAAVMALLAAAAVGASLWRASLSGFVAWVAGSGSVWPALPGKLARCAAVLAACALLFWLRARAVAPRRWLIAALGVIVLGDSMLAARGVCPAAPPEIFRHSPPVLRELQKTSEPRVYVQPQPLRDLNRQFTRLPVGWEPRWGWALGSQDLLWPPTGGRWRVRGSYDGDFTGLAPQELSLLGAMLGRADTPEALRLLRMASVDYVLSLKPPRVGGLPEVAEFMSVYASPIALYRVPGTAPKVSFVGRSRVASEPESYGIVRDPGFDPGSMVVLAEGRVLTSGSEFEGRARVLDRRSDRVLIETESRGIGYLVLSEAYHPGWRATIDGVAARVERANVLFRAVLVPEGRHQVDLRYRPPGLLAGLTASMAGLALGLAVWVRRRRAPPA